MFVPSQIESPKMFHLLTAFSSFRMLNLKIAMISTKIRNKSDSDMFTSGKTSDRYYHPSEICTLNSV